MNKTERKEESGLFEEKKYVEVSKKRKGQFSRWTKG